MSEQERLELCQIFAEELRGLTPRETAEDWLAFVEAADNPDEVILDWIVVAELMHEYRTEDQLGAESLQIAFDLAVLVISTSGPGDFYLKMCELHKSETIRALGVCIACGYAGRMAVLRGSRDE